MPQSSEQEYLLRKQYPDASNLNARIDLHERFSVNRLPWHRWVFDRLDLPPEARILELGCGPGRLWVENLDRIPEGWNVTLSDLSEGMLAEAGQNLDSRREQFTFEIVDAQAIPYADGSFDAVIANHMLYHVPDRARAYAEVRRVLKAGGRVYAATNGRDHLRELYELVNRFGGPSAMWKHRSDFKLENGQSELLEWFPNVRLHSQENALVVTEAGPLVAYVLSTMAVDTLTGEKLDQFAEYVEREVETRGAIRITKDSGMFEAWTEPE